MDHALHPLLISFSYLILHHFSVHFLSSLVDHSISIVFHFIYFQTPINNFIIMALSITDHWNHSNKKKLLQKSQRNFYFVGGI